MLPSHAPPKGISDGPAEGAAVGVLATDVEGAAGDAPPTGAEGDGVLLVELEGVVDCEGTADGVVDGAGDGSGEVDGDANADPEAEGDAVAGAEAGAAEGAADEGDADGGAPPGADAPALRFTQVT